MVREVSGESGSTRVFQRVSSGAPGVSKQALGCRSSSAVGRVEEVCVQGARPDERSWCGELVPLHAASHRAAKAAIPFSTSVY